MYGAKALEQYLFEYRSHLWSRLVWTGKRANPPNVVIHRIHLMMELDVCKAVCDVLCENDSFWESNYFQSTLEDGSFLAIDYPFFVKSLFRTCNEKGFIPNEKEKLLTVLHSHVMEAPLKEIVNEFVVVLSSSDPKAVLEFVQCLALSLEDCGEWSPKASKATLVLHLIGKACFTDVSELLCANAFLTQGHQIKKLLCSESADEQELPQDTRNATAFISAVKLSDCCCTRESIRSSVPAGASSKSKVMFAAVKSFMWYSVVSDVTKRCVPTKKMTKSLDALLSATDYSSIKVDNEDLCFEEGLPKKKRKSEHNNNHKHKHCKSNKEDWANEVKMMFGGLNEAEPNLTTCTWKMKLHNSEIRFSLNDAAGVLQQKCIEEFCEEVDL